MSTYVEKIRTEIKKQGGLKSFPSSIRKNRNSARPTRYNLKNSLKKLSDEELNVAFHLELIGNNRRKGTIVKNACER
jgi:hypothetical protein